MTIFKVLSIIAVVLMPSLASTTSSRVPIKIGILDTGFGPWKSGIISMCATGHADFSNRVPVYGKIPVDRHGHGTHITFLIHQAIMGGIISQKGDVDLAVKTNIDYCFVIVKFYDKDKSVISESMAMGIEHLTKIGVDYINISAGGIDEVQRESVAIKAALDKNIGIIASAGNESTDMAKQTFYPASGDDRIIVVGGHTKNFTKSEKSNFGDRVDIWELGDSVMSAMVNQNNNAELTKMTGTSQATAIVTGKIVRSLIREKKNASRQPTKSERTN